MPYRAPAAFSWQSTDQYAHARRVVAAIVLVGVGWATGFFAGRMSAWLFPVTNSDTAAVTGVLERSSPRAAGPATRTRPYLRRRRLRCRPPPFPQRRLRMKSRKRPRHLPLSPRQHLHLRLLLSQRPRRRLRQHLHQRLR